VSDVRLSADAWPVMGIVLWLSLSGMGAAGLLELTLIDVLLTFGIAFVVPLHLERLRSRGSLIPPPVAALGAGSVALGSFLVGPGALSAMLTLPWLVVCVLIAVAATQRLFGHRIWDVRRLIEGAAPVYLVVGATWLAVFRLGARPLGLSIAIVELTAVHFTFAGFAAPLLAVAVSDLLEQVSERPALAARMAGAGIVTAMPVVAIGFFTPPAVAAAGTLILAVSLCTLAVVLVPAGKAMGGLRQALLLLAELPVGGTMLMALYYAGGPLFGLNPPGIATMAGWHGAANAFLFTACSAVAFMPARASWKAAVS
jgi:hypothetical protein